MNSKLWIQKALSMCLLTAIVASYSMVALANSGKAAGELLVTGTNETSFVTVNGEPSQSGRTVFSSSTIVTPESMGAIVNLGKAGKIQFGPNTRFTLSFDGKTIGGDLSAGSVTILSAAQSVGVRTLTGDVVLLNAGETATAGTGSSVKKDDDDDDGGTAWWIWAAIFGGAIAGVVIAATSDNNRIALGGGTTVVSASR